MALENNLSTANVTLITERENSKIANACSVGGCSGGPEMKRNSSRVMKHLLAKTVRVVSLERVNVRSVTPYCRPNQNVKIERNNKKYQAISGGPIEESSASKSWHDNFRLYSLFFKFLLFFLNGNDYVY